MTNKSNITNSDFSEALFDDLDPALLDDPILLLKWLDRKSQNDDPIQQVEVSNSKSAATDVSRTSRHTPRNIAAKDIESSDLLFLDADESTNNTAMFLEWLEKKVSAESKSEILKAYEVIEEYAYKYKLITAPLLITNNVATIRNLQNLLVQKREFRTMDPNKRYICGLALRQYIQFLTECQNATGDPIAAIQTSAENQYTLSPHSISEQTPDDLSKERGERARKWAKIHQENRESLERERLARSRKWASQNE